MNHLNSVPLPESPNVPLLLLQDCEVELDCRRSFDPQNGMHKVLDSGSVRYRSLLSVDTDDDLVFHIESHRLNGDRGSLELQFSLEDHILQLELAVQFGLAAEFANEPDFFLLQRNQLLSVLLTREDEDRFHASSL